MIAPLITRTRLEAAGFLDTAYANELARTPLGLTDVGARWGVSELFRPVAELLSVTAFEADAEEAARIAEAEKDRGWAAFRIETGALGAARGTLDLHILARPNNSSVYPVIPAVARRYAIAGFDHVRTVRVAARPLDELAAAAPALGEIIKLDVQGAEYDVIGGASCILASRTGCLIAEVQFMPCYSGIKLFSEIELALRGTGLKLYGLLDAQQRATRRLDKRRSLGRERLIQADAVFLFDPVEAGGAETPAALRRARAALLMAVLLGYFDFALEMIDAVPELAGDDGPLRRSIAALAAVDPDAERREVAALADAASAAPERAAVALGKLVDRRRDFHTYHDVTD